VQLKPLTFKAKNTGLADPGPTSLRMGLGKCGLAQTTKQYVCHLATSQDGVIWERSDVEELPRGAQGTWDGEMTCYPARIDTDQGESYLFYNGNNMGETGVGVAMLSSAK
jgi:hypothetical protein